MALIEGSGLADTLVGTRGDDTINGHSGNDTLDGGPGLDDLNGGPGSDLASYGQSHGNVQADLAEDIAFDGFGTVDHLRTIENLQGSIFSDLLIGDVAANVISGGQGQDVLAGSGGDDTLDGGAGLDTVEFLSARQGVVVNLATGNSTDGEGGTDHLIAVEAATGTIFADMLTGSDGVNLLGGHGGNDVLHGGGEDDLLLGGPGDDVLDGGADRNGDVAAWWNEPATVIDLTTGAATNALGTDTVTGIEVVFGSFEADTIRGDDRANVLYGGFGADVMAGAGGADSFAYRDPLDFGDTITDFQPHMDRIFLDQLLWRADFPHEAIGPSGQFLFGTAPNAPHIGPVSPDHFAVGAPVDGDDWLVLNLATKTLGFDLDGNGPAPTAIVATFTGAIPEPGDIWAFNFGATVLDFFGPAGAQGLEISLL